MAVGANLFHPNLFISHSLEQRTMKQHFSTLIFDMDGVIINSEELHARAKRMTLHKYDISYPENIFDDFKGRPDLDFWRYVVRELSFEQYSVAGLDGYKRNVYISLADELSLVPGVMDFIRNVGPNFSRIGLVSSATRADFAVAEAKFRLQQWFDVIVLGEDTRHHKPHPEPYLKAMTLLKTRPAETMVVEDSPNGVISAKSAGCHVVAITTSFPEEQLQRAGADFVAGSFDEISGMNGP